MNGPNLPKINIDINSPKTGGGLDISEPKIIRSDLPKIPGLDNKELSLSKMDFDSKRNKMFPQKLDIDIKKPLISFDITRLKGQGEVIKHRYFQSLIELDNHEVILLYTEEEEKKINTFC